MKLSGSGTSAAKACRMTEIASVASGKEECTFSNCEGRCANAPVPELWD